MKLYESDYKLMSLVWDNDPIPSGNLVKLCRKALGWKKSTTYTMVRKLAEKGLLQNESAVVSALVPRSAVEQEASDTFVEQTFDGSLPKFLTAFLDGKTLSKDEAESLKALIDAHKEV